jgi:hypothetical protein
MEITGRVIGKPSKRTAVMSKSEVITITIIFHLSGFRSFKYLLCSGTYEG